MHKMEEKKTKRILFVDPILQKGHVVFNQIYINALRKEDVKLSFVFVRGFDENLVFPKDHLIYSIPKVLFKYNLGMIGNRICYLIALFLLRINVKFKEYDEVIFSSFEEISFFFFRIRNAYLVNHINISKIDSNVKYFFLKRVLKKNKLIVFDNTIKKALCLKGNFDVIVQPHGLAKPYTNNYNDLSHLDSRFEDKRFDGTIFSPSDNSSDTVFLSRMINNQKFINFLEKMNILLILKGNFDIKHDNIIVINFHLPKETYNAIFSKINIILIAYPNTFKNRVSGVLFESFANNKPCVVRKNDMLTSYLKHFRYDPYFSNIDRLINAIENIISFNNKEESFYKNLEELEPSFTHLF